MNQKQSNGNPFDDGPNNKWQYALIFVFVLLFMPQFILVAIPIMILYHFFLRKK